MSVFKRLDHIAIGVIDVEKAKDLFINVFGGQPLHDAGVSEEEGFTWMTFKVGGKKVELVSPLKVGEGGVGRYIEKYGEGFLHLSISVENLEQAIEYFQSKGVRVLAPRLDDSTWRHCYLHPKDTFGALIQVFEENDKTLAHAE